MSPKGYILGTYGTYFANLSNEEKFALANFAASKAEEAMGRKMTKIEYENFVWDFMQQVPFANFHEE